MVPIQAALSDPMMPDAGQIGRPMGNAPPAAPRVATPSLKEQGQAKPTTRASGENASLIVNGLSFGGNSLLSPEQILEHLRALQKQGELPAFGKSWGIQDLWKAADAVTQLYRENDYLARTWIPKQQIVASKGIVKLEIAEGKMGKLNIKMLKDRVAIFCGKKQVKLGDAEEEQCPEDQRHEEIQHVVESDPKLSNLIREQFLDGEENTHEILNLSDLEERLMLVNDLPGVSASSSFQRGRVAGWSDPELEVRPLPLVTGNVDYANSGVNTVGEHQFGATVAINNPSSIGDVITARLQGGSGSVYGRLSYELPITARLRWGVAGSGMYYVLGNQFKSLDADGDAWVGGTYAKYTLARGAKKNLYTQWGFDTRRYHNVAQRHVQSDKTVTVGYVGLQGDYRSEGGGNPDLVGYSSASFYLSVGDLDLGRQFDYVQNEATDKLGARTQGAYQKFSLSMSHLQRLPSGLSLYGNFEGQLSTKNLDSSEKFSLGGPRGVRAYPVNEGLSDEGYLLNMELRYDLPSEWTRSWMPGNWQVVGFVDHGGVKAHNQPWLGSGTGPNKYSLSGGGFGLNWVQPSRLNDLGGFAVNLSIAQRIGDNPLRNSLNHTDSDGTRDTPHFWAQLSKSF